MKKENKEIQTISSECDCLRCKMARANTNKENMLVLTKKQHDKYSSYIINNDGNKTTITPLDFEIIQTMKIHEGNKAVIEFDCAKYIGKQIEIGIRETS